MIMLYSSFVYCLLVYLYATGAITSDIVAPFTKLRKYLNGLGFNMFTIGDELEIRWGQKESFHTLDFQ
ncbi:MAG: hypothetical protein ABSF82_14905 [Candidatus Bathyarchaeia archaeon]|jgi:hypothetical protein